MGLFRKKIKNAVTGTLQVVGASEAAPNATYSNGKIIGVLSGEGIPARQVEHAGIFKASRWPQVGMTLPVTIDADNPDHFKIEWDQVGDTATSAVAQAQALAAAMNHSGGQVDLNTGIGQAAAGSDLAQAQLRLVQGGKGEAGQARILSAAPVHGGEFIIACEVARADGSVYNASMNLGFSTQKRQALFTTPGNVVPVLLDPALPAAIIPDRSRLPF